ncbi:MAG: Fe-S cluster assembly protein IscX [Thiofilum sp.]|uniref:Fe-S cluster assembly protein IscX n=1 Tax=Thiofilum sp. TaxID=2212733 RepID=UPI0025F5CE27|nr:Fe-S cluster assembly protein IscX [Thiofilum sp.]MBK8453365.1 Fe-S cluster assembly protein IscX [Thiofilum sp.]
MGLKCRDKQDIAIELDEAHPDLNPANIKNAQLRALILELDEFEDEPEKLSDKTLDAIRKVWLDERGLL